MEINIEPDKKQSVSDDSELAKVLAGVGVAANDDGDDSQTNDNTDLQYEIIEDETPIVNTTIPVTNSAPVDFSAIQTAASGNLDSIKTNALQDLRPLVDKVNASNEEKFDIYLLLLRSSDDKSLIEPAYNTARLIEDEVKRANALLDVIKEIDYLNAKK